MKYQFYFLYYVDDILVLQMYLNKFRKIYFHEQIFFKSLWQMETHVSFFEK